MQLRNAELFCDVVACRSFSKAAERRQVSQPAVSQALHQLEEHLGAVLIDRSKRPFELTPAGEIYYEGCRRLLDGFRKVEDRVQELGDCVAGRVRVASIYSVGLLQMAGLVERFRGRYPEVSLQLAYSSAEGIYDQIHREEADLGIVSFPKDGGEVSSIPWRDEEMVLTVPVDHRLADRVAVRWEDLDGEAFVGFESVQRIRRQIDRWLKDARVSVTVVHTFDNIENIKRAVEIGVGVSILPLATVRREVEHGFLRALPFKEGKVYRPLGIIHKRHKHLSKAAERFVEMLHEDAAEDDQFLAQQFLAQEAPKLGAIA
jgi:DNA-binding transcriptional LysR family regulator